MIANHFHGRFDELFEAISTKGAEPFNFDFRPTRKLVGPGLYIISWNKKPIYAGKYRPRGPGSDVIQVRLRRHVETLSLRGRRVGFNSESAEGALSQQFIDDYGQELRARRKDTGTVTSKNRVRFAMENWRFFKGSPTEFLALFEFDFFRFDTERLNQTESNKLISSAENDLIRAYGFFCNKEYDIAWSEVVEKNPKVIICDLFAGECSDNSAPSELTGPGSAQDVFAGCIDKPLHLDSFLNDLADGTEAKDRVLALEPVFADQLITVLDWAHGRYRPDVFSQSREDEIVRVGLKEPGSARSSGNLFTIRLKKSGLVLQHQKFEEFLKRNFKIPKDLGRSDTVRWLDEELAHVIDEYHRKLITDLKSREGRSRWPRDYES